MVELVDTRPIGVDHLFRPGDTLTVTLTWPTGGLVGRSFTSTLGAEALTVGIVGDVMTVSATGVQTGAVTQPETWLLTETTGGGSNEVLVGLWVPSTGPAARATSTVTVTEGAAEVAVTVTGQAELVAHKGKLHKSHVVVPAAWGENRWHTARDEADTRQVKVHLLGDSIFQGGGATFPRTQGCAELVAKALRDKYGDGGTGWLPSALTSDQFRVTTTGTPTGGTFSLHVAVNGGVSEETAPIAFNASAATVAAAIEALTNVPAGSVKASNGPLPTGIAVVFVGDLADDNVSLTAGDNNLTGGSSPTINVNNPAPWTQGMGMGGCQLRATGPAALHFADMRGSRIRIFHRNANITGSFRWRLDGGAWTTVTPPTSFGTDPGATDITVADTAHTVDIEWVSGTVDIFGVEATRTTGIVVYRFAQSGRAASDFVRGIEEKILAVSGTSGSPTITLPAPGSFTNSMVGRFIDGVSQIPVGTTITAVASATSATMSVNATGNFTNQTLTVSANGTQGRIGISLIADPFLAAAVGRPDLVIVQLGANDPAGVHNNADTFRAGMARILRLYTGGTTLDYSPDVIVVIEHIGNWFDVESEYAEMAAVAADVADGNGAALIDIWGIGHRSWKYWDDLGFFADNIHPNTAGHVQYAQPVIDLTTA